MLRMRSDYEVQRTSKGTYDYGCRHREESPDQVWRLDLETSCDVNKEDLETTDVTKNTHRTSLTTAIMMLVFPRNQRRSNAGVNTCQANNFWQRSEGFLFYFYSPCMSHNDIVTSRFHQQTLNCRQKQLLFYLRLRMWINNCHASKSNVILNARILYNFIEMSRERWGITIDYAIFPHPDDWVMNGVSV